MDSGPSGKRGNWTIVLRRADQSAVAVIVFVCLVAIAWYWIHQGGLRGRLVEIDHATTTSSPAKFSLNLNEAEWPELTNLPGVSETMARRIVDDRDTNGPFQSIENLSRVHGIGEKSIERIRPYVAPIEAAVSK